MTYDIRKKASFNSEKRDFEVGVIMEVPGVVV